ncbi:MAG: MGH1-like glycoside hydrolase domain-containing protein [Pyrinomonadaceae bacterium]
MKAEAKRLAESNERTKHWKRWGPYLSERAWGTVREDYSDYGSAWEYFPHDHARSRAYRWNEDGIAGICDRHQNICFSVALWNGVDPILKERLFGLTGNEGNHGEDVKEIYYYLDSTPTHSYMKYLYKYPQAEFPYLWLIMANRDRSKRESEFDLIDTGIFNEDKYFDVFVEYAKANIEDILIKVTVANRASEDAEINILPTVWLRNDWSWSGHEPTGKISAVGDNAVSIFTEALGERYLHFDGEPQLLFTENETNNAKLFGGENRTPYVKDGINEFVVNEKSDAVNPERTGTKAAANYKLKIPAGGEVVITARLSEPPATVDSKGARSAKTRKKANVAAAKAPMPPAYVPTRRDSDIFEQRKLEADEFYDELAPQELSDDAKNVQRQAFAGMLWSKQFYHYVVKDWLEGDPAFPKPATTRSEGRNHKWQHLYNADVISMPDKWEYPWYAAWDLAFHCLPLAIVDPEFAKEQLILMLREWYMHPNGQIPAYEWAFGDVNPPVHAWAALRVYQIEKKHHGRADRCFLARIFQKLLLNFTWWVNRKDADGRNVFEGGFLGLDNIGVFDRSQPLPTGGVLVQSDGTSWMAMYCLNMLAIALELSTEDDSYEDVASKFWEHFVYIADAMNNIGDTHLSLWDDEDGFYYDVLHNDERNTSVPIRVRSMVGLIPLFAVATIEPTVLHQMPAFRRRMKWFIDNRPDLTAHINTARKPGKGERYLLAIAHRERLERVLKIMLDESEFLSPYGIRALSRFHKDSPYILHVDGTEHRVDYEPAESTTGLFGGNSNWRGPVWFPVNYLLIESLQKFHHYYGDELKVECPTGSGTKMNLWQVAEELSRRLSHLFLQGADGRRPIYGSAEKFQYDRHFRDYVLFHEYFHGDNGSGLGASHQTGWTGLVAKLLQQSGE